MPPPPPGCVFATPTKRELLTRQIALFVAELEDAFTLLPDFCNRVMGVVITEDNSFAHTELSPQPWHMTLPKQHFNLLQYFTGCSLAILGKTHQENEKNITLIADLTYNSEMHSKTRDGYNQAMNRLQIMVEEARLESGKRKEAISRLKHEIRERKKAQREQLKLESQLYQAQKMEAIGLMAGGVAHDLNNILAGVVGYPDLLLLNLPQESDLRKPLENIKESGKRAAEVVADLLTIARSSATPNSVTNLNNVLCQYLDSLEFKTLKAKNPEVTFEMDLDENLANIYCSVSHIRKCLMNLIVNGSEAISGKGSLRISTENFEIKNDKIDGTQVVKKGEYAGIRVNDNGKGIADKHLKHIFEPFYSRKKLGSSGTGLGLTVVWNTVQEHNGTIHVTSDESGTSFELLFPITRKSLPEDSQVFSVESLCGTGETIMIVDDEKLLLDLAETMLTKLNYQVVTMGSGEEAISYALHHDVDLIILDMIMDPGINGRETYEAILAIKPGQPAIIASGFAENEEVEKVLKLGAFSFLRKPYTTNSLGKAVKDGLEQTKQAGTTEVLR